MVNIENIIGAKFDSRCSKRKDFYGKRVQIHFSRIVRSLDWQKKLECWMIWFLRIPHSHALSFGITNCMHYHQVFVIY